MRSVTDKQVFFCVIFPILAGSSHLPWRFQSVQMEIDRMRRAENGQRESKSAPRLARDADRRRVLGWIVFGAVSLLWPFLWFGVVLNIGPNDLYIVWVCGLTLSALSTSIRLASSPRTAWVTLACLVAAAVLWSLAMNLGDGPANPWAGHYQLFVIGMQVIGLPALLLWFYLLKRRGDAGRSGGN